MMKEATRLIRGESGSSLLLYLQEMDVNRVRDDVKAEAFAVYGVQRSVFRFRTAAFRNKRSSYHSLQFKSMARAKAGINAPLT